MCRVVSLPAVVSRMKNDAELAVVEPLPVHLGLDEPGRDVVARLLTARVAELAPVLDQIARVRARERELAVR